MPTVLGIPATDGQEIWKRNLRHHRNLMYSSETMVADLNQDGDPELILTTYGDPENINSGLAHGYLMILDSSGNILHDIELPQQGTNGNGKGAPASPTVMDLDGDSGLEIIVQTFGVGCFIYTVPGSAENLLLWPTGRGNYLRDGRPWQLSLKGDIDNSQTVDLLDVILGLRILSDLSPDSISTGADVNSDNRIGLAEVLYSIRKTAEP